MTWRVGTIAIRVRAFALFRHRPAVNRMNVLETRVRRPYCSDHQSEQAKQEAARQYDEGFELLKKRDHERGIELIKKAAVAGNPDALFFVGVSLAQADHRDYRQAMAYLMMAMEQGHLPAYREAARIFEQGLVQTSNDKEAAHECYLEAAESGQPLYQCEYGLFLQREGRDPADTIRFFQLAVDQGYPEGQFLLGKCYLDGYGVPEDRKRAMELLLLAAEQDQKEAIPLLGMLYMQDLQQEEGFAWLERGVALGSPVSMVFLAEEYYSGKRRPRNLSKCGQLLTQAEAVSGLPIDGKSRLAECYYEGAGVPQDIPRALEVWRSAEVQNNPCSQYGIGKAILQGHAEGSIEDALRQISGADEGGHSPASVLLGDCYLRGVGVEKNEEKAFQMYKKAADLLDKPAMKRVGWCYHHGIGVSSDLESARTHYLHELSFSNERFQEFVGKE